MWQDIEQAITNETGEAFNIMDKQSISGGDINLAFKVTNGDRDFFVKIKK